MTNLDVGHSGSRDAVVIEPPTLGERIGVVREWFGNAWYELRKSKTALCGFAMLSVLAVFLILTPWITSWDPIKQDYRARLAPPSAEHVLGTDRLGRDIYSRLLWGGRRLVAISLLAVAFGLMIGIPYGVLSCYYGGWTDTVGMRVVDGLLAFPGLLL